MYTRQPCVEMSLKGGFCSIKLGSNPEVVIPKNIETTTRRHQNRCDFSLKCSYPKTRSKCVQIIEQEEEKEREGAGRCILGNRVSK